MRKSGQLLAKKEKLKMKLLGANEINYGLLPHEILIDEKFKPYHQKTEVSTDGNTALITIKRKPKYQYVTVPKTTKYNFIAFRTRKPCGLLDQLLVLKEGDEINIIDFG